MDVICSVDVLSLKARKALRQTIKHLGKGNTADKTGSTFKTVPGIDVVSIAKPRPDPLPIRRYTRPAPRDEPQDYEIDDSIAGPSRSAAAVQIISSLFTSNPLSSLPKSRLNTFPTGLPSNAPLVGDASTFAGVGLDPLLARHMKEKMAVDRPTGIQRSALPYLLSAPLEQANGPAVPIRDVLIQSQTGSGKTLTYLLPIIQTLLPLSRLSYIDRSIGTLAIILAPTKELAQQISKRTVDSVARIWSLDRWIDKDP